MKNFEVNIYDYFSEDEIKEAVKDQFLSYTKDKIAKDAERLLGNFAHFQAQKIVDELLTDDQKKMIQEKTEVILNNISSGTVFHKSWYHREPDSVALQILNQTVQSNRDSIIEKVVGIISSYDYEDKLHEDAANILKDAIIKKLSHKCEE